MLSTKLCTICGLDKPASEYTPQLYRPNGLVAACKACAAKKARAKYALHRIEITAKARAVRASIRTRREAGA